jgi:mannose-6-phosphate isomerase
MIGRLGADAALGRVYVSPGDSILIKRGTIHALTPGVTVLERRYGHFAAETLRLYDFGRGRSLRIQEANAVSSDVSRLQEQQNLYSL